MREGGGREGWNRCLPRSLYGTHRQRLVNRAAGKKRRVSGGREGRRGGRVHSRDEGSEKDETGFLLGEEAIRRGRVIEERNRVVTEG